MTTDFSPFIPPYVDPSDVDIVECTNLLLDDMPTAEYAVYYKGSLVGSVIPCSDNVYSSWVCDVGDDPDMHGLSVGTGAGVKHILKRAYYAIRFTPSRQRQ